LVVVAVQPVAARDRKERRNDESQLRQLSDFGIRNSANFSGGSASTFVEQRQPYKRGSKHAPIAKKKSEALNFPTQSSSSTKRTLWSRTKISQRPKAAITAPSNCVSAKAP
jgi:hypothetical protein